MTLGMRFALCIQGSQRALQLGFCYFQSYTWTGHRQRSHWVIASLWTELILNTEIEIVTVFMCINTSSAHKHPQTADNYMLKGKSDIKTFGPKHAFVCNSRVKLWNSGLHFGRLVLLWYFFQPPSQCIYKNNWNICVCSLKAWKF